MGVYDHSRVAAEFWASGPSEGYVAALGFSELCRDDAAWNLFFLDVRGPYGRVGIALELELVALLGYACT